MRVNGAQTIRSNRARTATYGTRCAVSSTRVGTATHAMHESGRRTSRRISRVLYSALAHRVAAIHLGLSLPTGSSDLPAGSGGPPSIACANRLVSQSILLDLAP